MISDYDNFDLVLNVCILFCHAGKTFAIALLSVQYLKF